MLAPVIGAGMFSWIVYLFGWTAVVIRFFKFCIFLLFSFVFHLSVNGLVIYIAVDDHEVFSLGPLNLLNKGFFIRNVRSQL